MKIDQLDLKSEGRSIIINVDRSIKQPNRGYTYGSSQNKTYLQEVNVGQSKYDLLRDVEFLVLKPSQKREIISCKNIFQHFCKLDRIGGKYSLFNDFLGLEDLREIFKQRNKLPRRLQCARLFGWQSLTYFPTSHPASPSLFVPYVDINEPDARIEHRKRTREWFEEGEWFAGNEHFWHSGTFLSPRFRAKP